MVIKEEVCTIKRFKDNLPGIDWFKSFMGRHPDLTIKLAENTKRVGAGLSYDIVKDYFENLGQTIENIPPSHIVNYDETIFVDDPGSWLIEERSMPIELLTHRSPALLLCLHYQVMAASFHRTWYTRTYGGWTEGGIKGARYNRTLSGWFGAALFEDWLNKQLHCRTLET